MPNWCKNNLRIRGNGEKVLELLELVKNDNGEFTFTKFLPLPKELVGTIAPTPETMSEEEKNRLRDKYGATNWYEWQCINWGVKWDAGESAFYKEKDDWMITFQTPWGPPVEFVQALSKEFNKIDFYLQYADENEGYPPVGQAYINDGNVIFSGPIVNTSEAREFAMSVWNENWVYCKKEDGQTKEGGICLDDI